MRTELADQSALFKNLYGERSKAVYNTYNPLLGRCKKRYDFTGKRFVGDVPLSFQGGVGSGRKPRANLASDGELQYTRKKVYASVDYDRESLKASLSSEGAFVNLTKEKTAKTVESWMRNMSRILFNQQTGELGAGDNSTVVTGDGSAANPYVVTISAATWKEANWEEKDFINYQSEVTELEITEVDTDNRQINLVGSSTGLDAASVGAVAISGKFYMQNSKDNDPIGLKDIFFPSGNSLYNIPISRRWEGYAVDNNNAGIDAAGFLNKDMLKVHKKCGTYPDLVMTSYDIYEKIANQLEDKKTFFMPPRYFTGNFGFEGLEWVGPGGPVGIFFDRFCDPGYLYYLNMDHILIHHAPDFGWFDDDGTVFMRKSNGDDAYEATYGGYLQNYIKPPYHGLRYNIAV